VTSRTEFSGGIVGEAGIADGNGLEIEGFLNPDGSITATEIKKLGSPVSGSEIVLQGVVANVSSAAYTYTVAGITVNASTVPADEIDDDGDTPLTLSGFFAKLTENRTVVKAKGSYGAGVLTANKIEIE